MIYNVRLLLFLRCFWSREERTMTYNLLYLLLIPLAGVPMAYVIDLQRHLVHAHFSVYMLFFLCVLVPMMCLYVAVFLVSIFLVGHSWAEL